MVVVTDRLLTYAAAVTKPPEDWPREWRPVPTGLAAEAAANPGGSVAEIDGSMVSDANGYVPPEAIIGLFLVGPDGVPTGEYVRNPRHGPVRDDYDRPSRRTTGWDGSPDALAMPCEPVSTTS